MIDEVYKLSGENIDPSILQKILNNVHINSTGIEYTDSEPSEVPFGKMVVYDDGDSTQRVYFKTGEGSIGYIALTMV